MLCFKTFFVTVFFTQRDNNTNDVFIRFQIIFVAERLWGPLYAFVPFVYASELVSTKCCGFVSELLRGSTKRKGTDVSSIHHIASYCSLLHSSSHSNSEGPVVEKLWVRQARCLRHIRISIEYRGFVYRFVRTVKQIRSRESGPRWRLLSGCVAHVRGSWEGK